MERNHKNILKYGNFWEDGFVFDYFYCYECELKDIFAPRAKDENRYCPYCRERMSVVKRPLLGNTFHTFVSLSSEEQRKLIEEENFLLFGMESI
jgi:hypothetical protein